MLDLHLRSGDRSQSNIEVDAVYADKRFIDAEALNAFNRGLSHGSGKASTNVSADHIE